jgi:glyoxylase-like metal-dependent hydrolase (beta-lactamase superfamily II)
MNRKLGGLSAALSSMGLLLGGCAAPENLLDETVKAMGGDALDSAVFERTVGAGVRYDPGESQAPGKNVKVSDVTQERLLDLEGRRSRTRYQVTTSVLFPMQLDYREIINGKSGYVDGVDSGFGGPPRSALGGSRLAARDREAWLLSPARLLKAAFTTPQRARELAPVTRDGKSYEVLEVTVEPGAVYRLLVDHSTHRVARTETLEDHPPMGDVVVSAVFEDYKEAGGVQVPGKVTVWADEHELHEETRSELGLPATAAAEQFSVLDDFKAEATDAELQFGSRLGQWGIGFGHLGLSFFYADFGAAPVLFSELAPGVQLIGGTAHNMLLVEMADYLVLVDAPLYESRSLKVLEALKQRYPTKPLRYVALTHFHYDHSGGLRTFLAEGNVTVLVQSVSAGFVQQVIDRPHTLAPDRFEREKKPVTVKAINMLERLTDSQGRVLELHKIATGHADDMLVAYVPAAKLLYETDFFSPDPQTNGQPALGSFRVRAGELYDEVLRLGLPVDAVAGGHGTGTATLAHLRAASGR